MHIAILLRHHIPISLSQHSGLVLLSYRPPLFATVLLCNCVLLGKKVTTVNQNTTDSLDLSTWVSTFTSVAPRTCQQMTTPLTRTSLDKGSTALLLCRLCTFTEPTCNPTSTNQATELTVHFILTLVSVSNPHLPLETPSLEPLPL
jgi:hypothetical protein